MNGSGAMASRPEDELTKEVTPLLHRATTSVNPPVSDAVARAVAVRRGTARYELASTSRHRRNRTPARGPQSPSEELGNEETRKVSRRAFDFLGFGMLVLLIVAFHKNLYSEGQDEVMQAEVDAIGEMEGNFLEAKAAKAARDSSDDAASKLQNVVLVLIDDQGYNDMGKHSTDLSVSCSSRVHYVCACARTVNSKWLCHQAPPPLRPPSLPSDLHSRGNAFSRGRRVVHELLRAALVHPVSRSADDRP